MTVFSIAGVMIGVAALIIVLSVMGGFEHDLKSKMLRGLPHIEVLNEAALLGFSLDEQPVAKFQKKYPEAVSVAPFIQTDVVLKQGKHLAAVSLFGVDPQADQSMWAFHDRFIEGQLSDIAKRHPPLLSFEKTTPKFPGIVLGDALAGQLGANLGDEIVILSPEAASSHTILGGGTLTRSYVLVGTFHSGLFNYDAKWAVVTLDEARKFMPAYDPGLDEERYVTGIALNVPDPTDMDDLVASLERPEGLQVKTWKDSNAALLFALTLEKYTMGAILMLIVLVAAFSISGTMMMTVFHKKTQISLLRSIGMTKRDVGRLFLIQGMTVGAIGIVLGLGLGLGVCFSLSKLRYLDVPANLMSIRALPVKFLPVEYGVICVMAWGLSMLGALYPALTAARQNPSNGLRYS
jgi:lipoprotein-releasing system permease protein